ncbi:hypothetical protein C5O25_04010 [Paramuribaculum intestinale]|jgi:hypothetical protein|uniref:Very short patch repair endonuclease n=1 Tax=Paramuribaculum intestinale TaxID=2094151 RepID=A0A2V1IWL8_9BACT|nr:MULTISPECIES: hypothetical protein [Bacteroidales]PWB08343.1 hypothetical protein C5O25_04010 [Paramuribaculum intestinale]DAS70628.1 MAG TPA: hypothetical protein [Caudoviricetes sp.]
MGTENKQKRKERNLRYQMRKKGYQFNREQRVAILPENGKNRSAVQEKRLRAFGYDFQYNMFQY